MAERSAATTDATTPARPDGEVMSEERYKELTAALARWTDAERPALERRAREAWLYLDPSLAPGAAASARADLEHLDRQIAELAETLKSAEVIVPVPDKRVVQPGTRVTVRHEGDDRDEELVLVGPWEAVPGSNAVASSSPLGRALDGKRPGDRVTAQGGDGEKITVQIVSVKTASAVGTDTAEG